MELLEGNIMIEFKNGLLMKYKNVRCIIWNDGVDIFKFKNDNYELIAGYMNSGFKNIYLNGEKLFENI